MTIPCSRMFDGKVSIRIQDREVYILPVKEEITLGDLQKALVKVVKVVTGEEVGLASW
jgi:hypothetical protein